MNSKIRIEKINLEKKKKSLETISLFYKSD